MTTSDHYSLPALTSDQSPGTGETMNYALVTALRERYDAQLAQDALITELRHRAESAERQPTTREHKELPGATIDAGVDMDMSKGRIETLSDGVFAVAITLLVLDLHVPGRDEIAVRGIWGALSDRWPNYLGFLLSFLLIGQVWANHRTMFSFIRRADPTLVVLNTLLLLNIATLPFCTALLTAYIARPYERQAALLIYTGTLALGGLVYNALWWHAAYRQHLLVPHFTARTVRILTRNYLLGPTLYTVAFALAFVSGIASLILCAFLILLYLVPGFAHRVRRREGT